MPRSLAMADRLLIHRLAQHGASVPVIAQRLHVSQRSVRRLLARPVESLAPRYPHCGRSLEPGRHAWRDAALALRRAHPLWGGQRLLLDLTKESLPGTPPPLRTLQRWLAQTDAPAAPPGRRAAPRVDRAARPHERWQMDAMDQVRLGNGQQASCLRIQDECTGAPLGNRVFPPGQLGAGARSANASAAACMV